MFLMLGLWIITDFGLLQEQKKVILKYMLNKKGPKTEPCGTPRAVSVHVLIHVLSER